VATTDSPLSGYGTPHSYINSRRGSLGRRAPRATPLPIRDGIWPDTSGGSVTTPA
jgi:hypothetical protein